MHNDGKAYITIAAGIWPTNFKAEAEALKKGATEIRDNLPRTKPDVVIFTDALSVLNKLQNPPPEGFQRDGNCSNKPNRAVDSSTPRDLRK